MTGIEEAAALEGIAETIWSTAAYYAASTALSYAINSALTPKANKNDFSREGLSAQMLSGVDPIATHQAAYGRTRKGGSIVFRAKSYGEQYLSEQFSLPSSAPYTCTVLWWGAYLANVKVEEVQANFIPEDDNHVYDYVEWTEVGGTPSAGEYSRASGVYTFAAADAGKNVRITYQAWANTSVTYLHQIVVLAAHECEEIEAVYANDQLLTFDGNGFETTAYWPYLRIIKHLGTPGEAADAVLQSMLPSKWTAAHTLEGHCYAYIQFGKDTQAHLWESGLPNITFVIKGKNDIYDPRDTQYKYTDNAALIVGDYLTNTQFGLGADYATRINESDLIAAANDCDDAVALAAGGTEPRYTINGVLDTADRPADILQRLVSAMAGRLLHVGGRWRIYAGTYIEPVETLTEDDMRGGMTISTRLSRRDAFNAMRGTFPNPANKWQPSDIPPLKSTTYYLEDGSEWIYKDVELRYTTSSSMAQRLLKIDLLRARQQISIKAPLKLSAYVINAPDTVALTLARPAWTSKPFETVDFTLVISPEQTGIDLTLRETAASVFDWSTSEESTVDPAPNTDGQSPFFVQSPGVPSVTEQLFEHFGFGVRAKALVTWAPSADARFASYDLQYKKKADTAWLQSPQQQTLTAEILDIEPTTYQIRVRAINVIGSTSTWSQVEATFVGLTGIPGDVTNFSVSKVSGVAVAAWDQSADLDVRIGGALVVRQAGVTSGAAWEDGVIFDEFPGGNINGILPLVTGTYMAKFRDTSGKYSTGTALFVVTEGMITGFTTVGTLTEASGFTGTKTGVTLNGSQIELTSVPSEGTYNFHAGLDLTSVATRRAEVDITTLSFDVGTLIDSITESIDDWSSIDGTGNINACDVTVYARTTDDNPAGSPTWGAWVPFMVSDFTCRAFQFKAVLSSTSSSYNIAVTLLTVHVKVP